MFVFVSLTGSGAREPKGGARTAASFGGDVGTAQSRGGRAAPTQLRPPPCRKQRVCRAAGILQAAVVIVAVVCMELSSLYRSQSEC